MAASGYTPILIYASGTATNVPLAANLTSSASGAELALNYADGKLYYKNSSGVVTLLSASGGGPAGGSNTQVQFNSSGVLAGSSLFTWDGTTLVTPSHTTSTATTGSTNKGPLNYGTLSFSDTGIVQSAQTSVNSYFQNVIQNTSAGTAASAEFIAYNDQGTASTNYATVGINSSGYTGTGSINAPGYAYFLSASTDLVLGTIGANGIHFTTNSSATDALAISSAGAVSLPGGTANGVAYLNGSKVVTTGSALTFDGANLGIGTSSPGQKLHVDNSFNGSTWIKVSNGSNGAGAAAGVLFGNDGGDLAAISLLSSANSPANSLFLRSLSTNPLVFGTNNTERMRLDSSGNLLVGTTTQTGTFNVTYTGTTQSVSYNYASNASFTNAVVRAAMAGTSSSAQLFLGQNNNTAAVFYVNGGGAIYSTSIVITAISDQRLKENVRDIEIGLDAILALKPRRFDWKDGKGQNKKDAAGFIAQEFQTVFPKSVSKGLIDNDGTEYLTMNHEELIPSLVKAIQEQQAIIESLTTRLAAAGI